MKIAGRRGWLIGGLVAVALVAVVAVVLFTGNAPLPTAPPAATPTSTTPQPVTQPLTGLPPTPGVDLRHPAVAIKVSDVRPAHPQVGVDRADIVFVEPIGAAYTRLLAVFHSQLPARVGPVRSMRPMDGPLLSPMAPVFGNTMAARWVVSYIDSIQSIDDLGTLKVTGSGAYVVDSRRPRPDHVFVQPKVLMGLSRFTQPPAPYFSYAGDAASGSAASSPSAGSSVAVPYGPGWNITWTYDAAKRRYLRSEPWGPHRMADGTRINAVNVLVLRVSSRVGKIGTGSGAPVPILNLVNGFGTFVALSGGHAITGTWSKAGLGDHFVLRSDAGEPLLLSPGNTWVELPTPSARVTIR